MTRPRRAAPAFVAVALLAVLAGCSGLGDPAGERQRPAETATATATPVPVPTADAEPAGPRTPAPPAPASFGTVDPGDEIEGVEALFGPGTVSTQRTALEGRSVTVVATRRVVSPSGTETRRTTVEVAPDRDRYHKRVVRGGPDKFVWTDGEAFEFRLAEDGLVVDRITTENGSRAPPADPMAVPEIGLATVAETAETVRAVRVDDDGAALYIDLREVEALESGRLDLVTDAVFTVRMRVDGFVEAYRVELTGLRGDERVDVVHEVAFYDVGETTVPPVPFDRESGADG